MLQIYEQHNQNDAFNKFFEDKMDEMISFNNPRYKEIIRDMIIDYQKKGCFDVESVIDDIRTINCTIAEQVAAEAIHEGIAIGHWDTDNDYVDFLVETADDIIDSVFLGQDLMISLQEMIYDTIIAYDIPILMKRGMFFEYPEILGMFSFKGDAINALPETDEVTIHSGHAQKLMFDGLLDGEPAFYGRNNILIFDVKETEESRLLEG